VLTASGKRKAQVGREAVFPNLRFSTFGLYSSKHNPLPLV
jgi:hypothetical protein